MKELEDQLAKAGSGLSKLYESLASLEDATVKQQQARSKELRESDEYRRLTKTLQAARRELNKLVPPAKREPFVWLYRRIGAPGS